ncbi:helix-turn-helix domain-containing protein [Hymenobacter qilianensis]|uniref:Helix-turn-helix transcriptional regulator n=1 Tax=Hymenobacter qilianensis TaxID=1385715 RepID=A0A7H0GSY3_9BACT|nr:helix-turn-helix transcriptional regulator [Hymenobacter qilianensis]QNP51399.1 helix-turn-helix transcriptional regulator [Hymenobacter qilianensis]
MVERIRQILQTRQLSPTQFADALGLARPIISHVLSGRNKPSLEVVQKIIAAFPDISLPWLLSGQGPMMASVASQPATLAPAALESTAIPVSPGPTAAKPRPKRTAAHAQEATVPVATAAPPAQPASSTPAPPAPVYAAPAPESMEAPRPASPEVATQPALAPSAAVAAPQNAPQAPATPAPASPDLLSAFAEPGKTIRRIVIFYHDGTFSAYQPEMPG